MQVTELVPSIVGLIVNELGAGNCESHRDKQEDTDLHLYFQKQMQKPFVFNLGFYRVVKGEITNCFSN